MKALSGQQFDVTSSGKASKEMMFEPYRTLITYQDKQFVLKACDTRGLNDPDIKDEDTYEAVKNLYLSEFNLINRVVVCFKLDRIRAGIDKSIISLVKYLKTIGFKKENVILALTFCDGYKSDQINNYINEMKDHPLVSDLFTFALEIVPTSLPDLTKQENDFREIFAKRRDGLIEKYYSILSEYVEPVKLMTHEKFMAEIERHKVIERDNITDGKENKLEEIRKQNDEELAEGWKQKIVEYTEIMTKIKSNDTDNSTMKQQVQELKAKRNTLKTEIKQLEDEPASKIKVCPIQ